MLNDFRPPLAEDPAKRIVELEAENARLKGGLKAYVRLSVIAMISFVLFNFVSLCISLIFFDNNRYRYYIVGVGAFLLTLLIIFLMPTSDHMAEINKDKNLVSFRDRTVWMLVPIIVTILAILLIWVFITVVLKKS
jgi:Ca2+/Na+ antiporter